MTPYILREGRVGGGGEGGRGEGVKGTFCLCSSHTIVAVKIEFSAKTHRSSGHRSLSSSALALFPSSNSDNEGEGGIKGGREGEERKG